MSQLEELMLKIFGEGKDLTILQMSSRGVVIFIVTLILIHVSGTRSFGLKKALDNIVVILLGAVLSRAVVGASPFIPVVSTSFVIVLLHRLCAWVSIHNKWFSKLVDGEKVLVFKDGIADRRNMDKCLVSDEDLREQVRLKAQTDSLERIKEVYMERNGEMSAVKKEQN